MSWGWRILPAVHWDIILLYTHSNIVLFTFYIHSLINKIHYSFLLAFVEIQGFPLAIEQQILFWNLILLSLMWNLASIYPFLQDISNIWRNISCVNLFTYYRIYMAWLFKNLHMTWCLVSLFSHLLSLEFMLSHYIVIIVLCTELNTVLKGCLSLTHLTLTLLRLKTFILRLFYPLYLVSFSLVKNLLWDIKCKFKLWISSLRWLSK